MVENKLKQLEFKEPFSLYIHIPFCERKCSYCDFYSLKYSGGQFKAFLGALETEIELYGELLSGEKLETIYIGGGTPSLLYPAQLDRVLKKVINTFSPPGTGEISLESNPSSLAKDKLPGYKRAGINRLSLGVQSFNDSELKLLGRLHDSEEAVKVIEEIKSIFDNFNLDLISSLPGQTLANWEETLYKTLSFEPPHLSVYNLQLEEGTPLGKRAEMGEIKPLDDELDARIFLKTEEILSSRGYQHYEISNYAIPGFTSRHNRNYWEYHPYLGLGPAAHSFDGQNRFYNYSDLGLYLERLDKRVLPLEEFISLTTRDQMSEMMFMGLRLEAGVSLEKFIRRFGVQLTEIYGEQINELRGKGLLTMENGRLKLTDQGTLLGNEVFMYFL